MYLVLLLITEVKETRWIEKKKFGRDLSLSFIIPSLLVSSMLVFY